MPAMMVWPDSSSVLTRKDGSSARQAVEREAHLFLVALGLRLDGDLDDRLGELHALQDDRLERIAKRVARRGFLEAGEATMSPA
jgi:hypothetical protein